MHGLDVFLGFDWDVMSLFKIKGVLEGVFSRRDWGRDLKGVLRFGTGYRFERFLRFAFG